MQTFPFRVLGSAFVAVSAAVLASCAAPPQDASGVLARASEAMGSTRLDTSGGQQRMWQ